MILDKELLLCDAQAICDAGINEYSTYAIDLGVARYWAGGEPLAVVLTIDELFAGTAATLSISLVTATATNLITNQKILYAIPAIAKAKLTAGRKPIVLPVPPLAEMGSDQRYFGLMFIADSVSFETTGKVTAYLTPQSGIQTNL